jgi:hypothetical protein
MRRASPKVRMNSGVTSKWVGRVQARAFHEGRGQGLQVGVGGAGGRLGCTGASTGPAVQGRVPTGMAAAPSPRMLRLR